MARDKNDLLIIGNIGQKLPDGFVHRDQVPEFLLTEPDAGLFTYTLVGEPGCYGIAWGLGFLRFEAYTSDIEPTVQPGKYRMILWQRISRTDKPPGWYESSLIPSSAQVGFAEIKHPEAYWQDWVGDARRNRTRFLRQKDIVIRKVDYDTYIAAYVKIKKLKKVRQILLPRIVRKEKMLGKNIEYLLGYDTRTGRVLAGLATLDLPGISQSIHHSAFVDDTAPRSSVGTGLVDYWFQSSIKKGIRFQNFGFFWGPGVPRSWKGFSRFKAQFGIHMIRFPKMLVKITKGGESNHRERTSIS